MHDPLRLRFTADVLIVTTFMWIFLISNFKSHRNFQCNLKVNRICAYVKFNLKFEITDVFKKVSNFI